ncbi:MAG: DUF1643 domain-containing protein [Leucobacter sp.]
MTEPPMQPLSVGALLLNPSLDVHRSTSHAVLRLLATRKDWPNPRVVNLIEIPTRNSKVLAQTQILYEDLYAARPHIESMLASSTQLIFAWGTSFMPGEAGVKQRQQIHWAIECAARYGHSEAWMMGGSPRHPSRWRQYVGPQRAIHEGGTTADRLERALILRPIETALPAGSSSLSEVGENISSSSVHMEVHSR